MNTRNLLEIVINEYLDVFIRRDVLKYSHMGNVYVSKVKNLLESYGVRVELEGVPAN